MGFSFFRGITWVKKGCVHTRYVLLYVTHSNIDEIKWYTPGVMIEMKGYLKQQWKICLIFCHDALYET